MSFTPSENGSVLPLRPALRDPDEPVSPRSGPAKVVSIVEAPETITLDTPSTPIEEQSRIKQFKTHVADRRMTGRPSILSSSSKPSLLSQASIDEPASSDPLGAKSGEHKHKEHHHPAYLPGHGSGHGHHSHNHLISQVAKWLQAERIKRAAGKSKKREGKNEEDVEISSRHPRRGSASSDSSAISLEKLQQILDENMSTFSLDKVPSPSLLPRRPSTLSARRRSSKLGGGGGGGGVSSDTEYQEGDVVVPSCDVILDNSKTLSYSGGAAESSNETFTLSTSKRAEKERKAWATFKGETLKLAHTLRLKGWRRVPLEMGPDLEVERLSGALTNAVYVVSPPKDIPSPDGKPHHQPPRLLLRVYGPQVERLIDRENELAILRRLARKKIGPRMLGTFKNGRFEEFFNAQTLTADDLRVEDTSKHIAKRMRELHDGIELLEREREEGPFVWRNWDKWVDRCEEVVEFLDRENADEKKGKSKGLICGVPWKEFRAALDKYRLWLDECYGPGGVNRSLVFAHNDTQYGNILRLVPESSSSGSAFSPLLLPQNSHKQLVVIDFEYASANTPGLEFANHFTEWCYNYHDASAPWKCRTENYPTLEQQRKFVRSYVNHRPQFNPKASATPKMNAMDGSGKGSISEFLLDSRTPGGSTADLQEYRDQEVQREAEIERQVQTLLKEVRIWRVANSAQWVAWGIVQAKVPGMNPEQTSSTSTPEIEAPEHSKGLMEHVKGVVNGTIHRESNEKRPEGMKAEALAAGETVKEAEMTGEEGEEDEFDYLSYTRERALFFWGDLVGLGLVKEEELPLGVREVLKRVEF